VDRDSEKLAYLFDERNEAVKRAIRRLIHSAHQHGAKVGICGQAPSDYPEFAEFLVKEGIDSISLNPDSVLSTKKRIAQIEKKLGNHPRVLTLRTQN
jgi:pyruvate,water dikinase